MNLDQRNKLFHRIVSDCFIIYINNKKYIIKRPSRNILCEAQLVYEKSIQNNKFNVWMSEKGCLIKLMKSGKWPVDGDVRIKNLEDASNALKVELYKAVLQSDVVKKIRKQLRQIEKSLNDLYEIKHSLDQFTTKGFAHLIREQFILLSTIYDNDQLLSNITYVSSVLLDRVRLEIMQQAITTSQFRELARTSPWRLYWGISDNPFNKSVVELDSDKRTLISFSKMYDNIYENPDCPSEQVINDDDMLDGWMILQKQERDEKKTEKTLDKTITSLSPKYQNASEIFLPAQSKEAIHEINKLNSPKARMVKKQRQTLIDKQGQVGHGKLPDAILEKNNLAHQQMKNAIKSK